MDAQYCLCHLFYRIARLVCWPYNKLLIPILQRAGVTYSGDTNIALHCLVLWMARYRVFGIKLAMAEDEERVMVDSEGLMVSTNGLEKNIIVDMYDSTFNCQRRILLYYCQCALEARWALLDIASVETRPCSYPLLSLLPFLVSSSGLAYGLLLSTFLKSSILPCLSFASYVSCFIFGFTLNPSCLLTFAASSWCYT